MSAIINGSSPSVTFSDGTTQATSAIVSGYVPYANLPAGSVLQVVTGTLSSSTSTASTSYVASGLSASITPKYSTSKIYVIATFAGGIDGGGQNGTYTLYKNSTNLGNANYGFGRFRTSDYSYGLGSLSYLDSPATTSSTTYSIYMRTSGAGNSVYIADVNGVCSITLLEIAG